ncbi:MAG TPA: glycosyltransferase [Anaerolineales bacterium]|nr:glycosyltransferase [Anaerolineales bacterium]
MVGAHVLQLIDSLNIGGAEILLRDLTVGLTQRGFRVSVGYSTPGPLARDLNDLGLTVTRLPRLMRIDPFLFRGMIRLMRKERPQIVHTHLFKSDFHGRLAARIAGVPVVVSTLHSIDRWAQKWPLGMLYGWTSRFADRIIAISDDVKNFHMANTAVDESKFVTIGNGVDVQRFSEQKTIGRAVRKEFNLNTSAPVFGIVGRLTPPKDHRVFLQCAALILQSIPLAHFLIVGDGPLRGDLESYARELDIRDSVIFTGVRRDIPAVLAALDVLVISSLWEGIPVTLLEGMASALPVVATQVGSIPEVVTEETALLVPPSDPPAMAQACTRLAHDRDLRRRLGQAGLKRVLAHYSIDAMIDRTTELYAELLRMHGLAQYIPSQLVPQANP